MRNVHKNPGISTCHQLHFSVHIFVCWKHWLCSIYSVFCCTVTYKSFNNRTWIPLFGSKNSFCLSFFSSSCSYCPSLSFQWVFFPSRLLLYSTTYWICPAGEWKNIFAWRTILAAVWPQKRNKFSKNAPTPPHTDNGGHRLTIPRSSMYFVFTI